MDIEKKPFKSVYLKFIDSGDFFRKPFKILYMIFAFLNVALPVFFGYMIYKAGFFSDGSPNKWKLFIVIIWLIVAAACWLGFLIWWLRKEHLEQYSPKDDEFVATHIFSHFVQTSGEWAGSFMAIVGFGASFILLFFLKDDAYFFMKSFGMKPRLSYFDLLRYPITGFMIVVFTRFFSEQIRAVTTIARNTKKD